ncbi:MAG: hypothetical protein Ct9H90mP4_10390 [Gammaproteobacteria bacterium]|nr:MAG: hypothetical protein Ct9H90mP4_10390 [Gammaproteobacteria bacterium]
MAQGSFPNIPDEFTATRYHSLVIEEETMGSELIVNARTEDGTIRAHSTSEPSSSRFTIPP